MASLNRLNGKTAIITGGASGLGAATVKHFVDEGARVVIADIQDDAGESLAASLGGNAIYHHTDVTAEADIEAVVQRAASELGGLDVMFNNAGGMVARGSILEIDVKDFDFAVALLVRSVFLGMKHAGKLMADQGHGSIISTSSIAGVMAGGGPHVYAMAKCAVVHLTKSVALELGESNVRVNCICPGGVATPLVFKAYDLDESARAGVEEGMALQQAIPRAGQPEDIAKAALFLASDDADYITGQALVVDGGEATGKKFSKQFMK